ncbi:unnamed protein product [Microthlaspi erraticum]|uniref:Uncharacterized protein n=1 Tax=Microthlaspi erraticum TaxID=1685480 RepID=A0A6D2L5N6_9BRAS|nr:unnamed protein product [Microthlaspi erraticum]
MAELTYRPGKQQPTVVPSKPRHHKPRTTAPYEQEGMALRLRNMTRAARTIAPFDHEGIVPRPAENFDQYHPSGRTRRMSTESLGHDRPDCADRRP